MSSISSLLSQEPSYGDAVPCIHFCAAFFNYSLFYEWNLQQMLDGEECAERNDFSFSFAPSLKRNFITLQVNKGNTINIVTLEIIFIRYRKLC